MADEPGGPTGNLTGSSRGSTPGDEPTVSAGDAPEQHQRRLGPYRLLEPLGEGGMGEVWLAQQEGSVRRRVALKIIRRGMDTKQVIARFSAEQQALALMDHPAGRAA